MAEAEGRLISEKDWLKFRTEAHQSMPDELQGEALVDVLLPYQKRLMQLTAQNSVTVVEKSRRTGVTWGSGADAVLTSAANRKAGGMDTLYIGYNLEMAREFIDVCAMWARSFAHAGSKVEEFVFRDKTEDGHADIQAFRIWFDSGFEIVALSSKPRSLRGRQGYVIIDEAAFHDALGELLKAAMALLMWGGKVLVISTHDGVENSFNGLVNEIRSDAKPYALLRVDLDDALRDGLYQRICLVRGQTWSPGAEAKWRGDLIATYGDAADEELFCIPSEGGGGWLPAALIEARMQSDIPVLRFEQPEAFAREPEFLRVEQVKEWCERKLLPFLRTLDPTLQHAFGVDFARKADLSVFWPFVIRRDLTRATPFVIELRRIPFEQQKQILFFMGRGLPRLVGGALDATGNGAYLAEVAAQEFGETVEEVHLSAEWYRTNMPRVKAAFEDDTIILPRDADIRSDFRAVKVVRGVARVPDADRERGTDGERRHGDSAIACALAYYASFMDGSSYDYLNVRDNQQDGDPLERDVSVTAGFGMNKGAIG